MGHPPRNHGARMNHAPKRHGAWMGRPPRRQGCADWPVSEKAPCTGGPYGPASGPIPPKNNQRSTGAQLAMQRRVSSRITATVIEK
jgi:hypothetical protein